MHQDPFLNRLVDGRYRIRRRLGSGGMGDATLGDLARPAPRVIPRDTHADSARWRDRWQSA